MIHICSKCGALLLEDAGKCSFCESPLASTSDETAEPVAVGVVARESLAEPEWRREVARRLEEYRVRRGRPRPLESQSGLPFHEISLADPGEEEPKPRLRPAPPRPRPAERVEISIQPELNFTCARDDRAHPQNPLVPVATIAQRRWAGLLDGLFLALTCLGFTGLFHSLGGQFALGKTDTLVYLSVAYLFYSQYFALFTTFAGATPGMQLCCLTIVRLDGSLPDTRQLLWRSFGYLLSGATVMLGFVWALWDEDRFTWQDRISQTYVTAAAPVANADSFEIPPGPRRFAHR
ncbi:MAG TPA: RDD family protein [Candidatus Acidoferrales bacterium]|nr:RDD family protein [Candidatus Acidoferrales bacterium]